MALTFTCTSCGKVYRGVSAKLAGKKVQCSCGKTMRLGKKQPGQKEPEQKQPEPKKTVAKAPAVIVEVVAPVRNQASDTKKSLPVSQPAKPAATKPSTQSPVVVEVVGPGFGEVDDLLGEPIPAEMIHEIDPLTEVGSLDANFEDAAHLASMAEPMPHSVLPVPLPRAKPAKKKKKKKKGLSSRDRSAVTQLLPVIMVVVGSMGIAFAIITLISFFAMMDWMPVFDFYSMRTRSLGFNFSIQGGTVVVKIFCVLIFIATLGVLVTSLAAVLRNAANMKGQHGLADWMEFPWAEWAVVIACVCFLMCWIVLDIYNLAVMQNPRLSNPDMPQAMADRISEMSRNAMGNQLKAMFKFFAVASFVPLMLIGFSLWRIKDRNDNE